MLKWKNLISICLVNERSGPYVFNGGGHFVNIITLDGAYLQSLQQNFSPLADSEA